MNTMTRDEAIASLTARGEPYEVEEALVRGVPTRVFRNTPSSLREIYAAAASDATFLVYGEERLTFAEANELANRLARRLVEDFGVAKGDRVAIALRNYPEWVLAFMAITSIGAIAAAMNAFWQTDELAYGLRDCGAKVLFADQERLERLTQMRPPIEVSVVAVRPARPDPRDISHLLQGSGPTPAPDTPIDPDDPAIILYTSGSTGHPKGAVSSHRAVMTTLWAWELDGLIGARMAGVEPQPPTRPPAALLAVPLFHASGLHAVVLMSFRSQRKVVAMYKWDAAVAAELIERERITGVTAPSAMTGDLLREAGRSKRDLSSLATVGGGGAARAPEQVAQIASTFGAMPGTGWGMTETNALGTGIGGPDYLLHPTSAGRCSPLMELRVVDEAGNALAPGQAGELLIRGAALFTGYWNRPEVNAENFLEGGWFRTGDVAYLDEEGYLYIVDRIKDLIIRGGENIGCGQIEAALLAHPLVQEAAVYAVPDDRLGEEVGATVYGDPDLDLDDLRTSLKGRLAPFETPRFLIVADAPLPRTDSGKILKRVVRDKALAELSSRPSKDATAV